VTLMKKITALLIALLVCVISIDMIWLFFPDYISRRYTIIYTIPIIMLFYFLSVEVKNILYLFALVTFMIADYFFFIEGKLGNGIASSGVGLFIYGIIILKQSHYISTKRLLLYTVPFLAIYMSPFLIIVEKINDEIFTQVAFYAFTIGYFSFMSVMIYLSKKTEITKKLLLAGVSTALMGALFGMYLFVQAKPIYAVFANILFVYSHYKMWQYIISKDSSELEDEQIVTL
jgi:hypothetical protein